MEDVKKLKQKAINGMIWSFVERFGSLFILFIANIVLARLLNPEHYGLIGMMLVFINLSGIFIDGGLGSALIQKKNTDIQDYSTIFWVNIVLAVFFYLLIFGASNSIAAFYKQPDLSLLLKVLGLVLLLDAFGAIQNTILIKELNFKRIAKIKISVSLFASVAAIVAALYGLGVWSLVIQYIVNSFFKSFFLWISTNWYPKLLFCRQSFNGLFNFGFKLLLASIISEVYRNIQVLIIGRFFPAKEVGYFSQANQLENVPTSAIITIIGQVTYPVFSKIQDSTDSLLHSVRRCIKLLSTLNFPIMILLAVIAKPLFIVLYSSKWIFSVPYFQWLCIGFGLLLVVHNTNLNLLKAIGKSDILLYLEIVKRVIGLILIFLFISNGVIGILWALAIASLLEFFLNGFFTGKYIGYGILKQARDILPILFIAFFTGCVSYSISFVVNFNNVMLLILQIISYLILYVLLLKLFKIESYTYIVMELKNRFQNE